MRPSLLKAFFVLVTVTILHCLLLLPLYFAYFRAVSSVGLEHHVDNVRVTRSSRVQPTFLIFFYYNLVGHSLLFNQIFFYCIFYLSSLLVRKFVSHEKMYIAPNNFNYIEKKRFSSTFINGPWCPDAPGFFT